MLDAAALAGAAALLGVVVWRSVIVAPALPRGALLLSSTPWARIVSITDATGSAVEIHPPGTTPARLEYTYAKVDRDAGLGAFTTDDFFWATGWEGHRVDIGVRSGGHTSLHAIGQLQRFKDSPRPEEREDWIKRYRLEWRFKL